MNPEANRILQQRALPLNTMGPEMDALLRSGHKLSPATMAVALSNHKWIPAPHLLHASTIITNAIAKGGARLIFTMPPRHGKSMFTSIYTPIWYMDKYPGKNCITATYGKDLVVDWGREIRDIILSEPPELDIRLKRDSRNVVAFQNTAGGHYWGVGVGGATTGKGAHLFNVDDFIKNPEESLSPTMLEKIWNWFKAVVYTRLEPGGNIIIIATRWAQQDLIGRIKDSDFGHKFTEIRLPAIAEDDDPLGRKVGDPLWPARYDLEALMDIKLVLGTFWWNAMYQQVPLGSMSGIVTGDMIKTMTASQLPPLDRMERLRAWDFAGTEETSADYTAGPLLARDTLTGQYIFLDMQRFQKSPKQNEVLVKKRADEDGHSVGIWLEQEPGSSGKAVTQRYQQDVLPGWDVGAERPTGPPEARCSPLLAEIEAGNVYMLYGSWNQAFRDEIDTFPGGAHDDQVVAAALAFNHLNYGQGERIRWDTRRFEKSPGGVFMPSGGGGKIITGATW